MKQVPVICHVIIAIINTFSSGLSSASLFLSLEVNKGKKMQLDSLLPCKVQITTSNVKNLKEQLYS